MLKIAFTFCCSLACTLAFAQSYPAKPIRLVIPAGTGASTNDILGRALSRSLSEALGQQLIVDNMPGASGSIGSRAVAKAVPDGYTLLIGYNGAQTISPHVVIESGYDPVKDLSPVARFCLVPYVLVINPSVKAGNLRELIALAKSRPGQLNYASSGSGQLPHLSGELFKLEAGINLLHVPYKAAPLAANDLIAGHVQIYFSGITSVAPFVKSGKMRALAVTAPARSTLLPDTPTAAEGGLSGLDVSSWLGLLAPARTPEAIVNRLYAEVAKITNSPEMKAFLLTQGAEPALLDPARFGELIRVELAKWGEVIKTANIKAE